MTERKEEKIVTETRSDGSPATQVNQVRYSAEPATDQKEAGYNLSWGAIFAGVLTFIALLLTFSLINTALGLGQFSPTDANPFDGMGTGQVVWTITALILAFLGGGFVAGFTARRVGFIHGFLTWAGSLVLTVILGAWLTSMTLSAVGNVASSVAGVAENAISSIASTASDVISSGMDAISDNVNVSQEDIDNLNANVEEILQDTEVEELQPEYLSTQVEEATTDISNAAQEIIVNPENSDQIFQNLTDSLTARVENISESVDEQAVANAVEANTDLDQAEAEEAIQNIIDGYNQAAQSTREGLENASAQLEQTQAELEASIAQLRQGTEEVTNQASGGSIWVFVGVVLGAIIAALGGSLGVNTAQRWVNEELA